MANDLPQQRSYSSGWALNADAFERQGCYSWMAKLLEPYKPSKVLDIGCGTGHGLLAITQILNPRLISIEENAFCLTEAKQLLACSGHKIDGVQRLEYHEHTDGTHSTTSSQSLITTSQKISLIQGDLLLNDLRLLQFLSDEAPFDAVTMWLIGTEPTRSKRCRDLAPHNIQRPEDYRYLLQRYVYQLASELLCPGGVIQVVDRVQTAPECIKDFDFKDMHQELIGESKLTVVSIDARKYQEPKGAGVGMVSTCKPTVRISHAVDLSMISIISLKG